MVVGEGGRSTGILLYSLFGHPLSKLPSHTTYLGVKPDCKLSWVKYISVITEITTKSSKVLAMVKITLGPCKPEVKDTAYNMLKYILLATYILLKYILLATY